MSPSEEIRKTLQVLFPSGGVVELRGLPISGGAPSGYYDDFDALADQAARLDNQERCRGIYVTLNKPHPDTLLRRRNKCREIWGKSEPMTSDQDIIQRLWFPIDLDPTRPSGISSTEEEKAVSVEKAEQVREFLSSIGFPEPIIADSGNGIHMLYQIDLPNNPEVTSLIKGCLCALDALFSDDRVKIDTSIYNAARIWRLYGTVSRKGDDTEERPHRRSSIMHTPEEIVLVSQETLQTLADLAPQGSISRSSSRTTEILKGHLGTWLEDHDIKIASSKEWEGGILYSLVKCPFSKEHTDGSFAIQFADGRVYVGCHHDSCKRAHVGWNKLRAQCGESNGDNPGSPPETPSGSRIHEYFDLTDLGNSEKFVSTHGEDLHYCPEMDCWLTWNEHIWAEISEGAALNLAEPVLEQIRVLGHDEPDPDKKATILRWAKGSASLAKRRAMIDGSKGRMEVRINDFDNNPDLFNCSNGTYDLVRHEFREHAKEDLITKVSGVEYDPSASCPTWVSHLDLILFGDQDLILAFQEICGYSLLHGNPEEIFVMLVGEGQNGKSKTVGALLDVFGDYGRVLGFRSFAERKGNQVNNDIATLKGVRYVAASESNEHDILDAALIKGLTGRDPVTARFLYREFFEFVPGCLITFSTNDRPMIRKWDKAIERRLWYFDFKVTIPEERRDPHIDERLRQEIPGIFNWMVEGLKRYQERGCLCTRPESVLASCRDYQRDVNPVLTYIDERIEIEPGRIDPEFIMVRSVLYHDYFTWSEENHLAPVSPKLFASTLQKRGVEDGGLLHRKRAWRGVRIREILEDYGWHNPLSDTTVA